MKKWMGILILCIFLVFPATAEGTDELYQEQLEASGAEQVFDNLPAETKAFLDKLGITGLDGDGLAALHPQTALNSLLILLGKQAGGPIRASLILLGILLLCALMDGTKQLIQEPAVSNVFGIICTLAACMAILVPLSGCIRAVAAAAESTSVFMISFVPVYAGVLLTGGQVATAASFQTMVLFVAELISLLATQILVPLMTICLALGITGSVSGEIRLDAVGGFMNKTASWMLGLSTSLFVGLLSLQGLIGSAADTLGARAIKFSLASFVPVVGGALSEALGTVQGCLALLKSTLGGFGMLATVLIVLPPLLQCVAWILCLSACGMVAEMFELRPIGNLLKSAQAVIKTLTGVLAACALFMIIATGIVTKAGGI